MAEYIRKGYKNHVSRVFFVNIKVVPNFIKIKFLLTNLKKQQALIWNI